jgi:hypothetical protein
MNNSAYVDITNLAKDGVKKILVTNSGQLLWKLSLRRLLASGYYMENYPSDLKPPYEYRDSGPNKYLRGLGMIPVEHQEILFKACFLPDGERLRFVKNQSTKGQSITLVINICVNIWVGTRKRRVAHSY